MRLARLVPLASFSLFVLGSLVSAMQGRAGRPLSPAPRPGESGTEPPSAQARPAPSGLRGVASSADENEASEADPAFDPTARWKRRTLASGASAATASASSSVRLASHPRREELARWIEQCLRGKEIDVTLLGGRKYMLNDCLGIKASAGSFRLELENPVVRFENTGLVLTLEIDHVSLSALKIRMRPNPNPLELCKFSKKFEIGGALDDVRLTLRMDPLYDLERCRMGAWGELNPEVRIGNLNLKPLQNNLDAMGKNMVEDALTFALQVELDGMLSALGDLVFSAVDQFLEADCPTKPGEAGRTTTRAVEALPGAATSAGNRSGAPTDGVRGADAQQSALLARLAELEARLVEIESTGPAPTDLDGLLSRTVEQLEGLAPGPASPELRAELARLVAVTFERAGLVDVGAELDELARRVRAATVGTGARAPAGAPSTPWTLVPNPELKGRVGRVVVRFPDAKLAGETLVVLRRAGSKVADRYGEAAWETLPGLHEVVVTNVSLADCEVRAGHDTVLSTGMLTIELGPETLFKLFRKGSQEKLLDRYGSLTLGLLVGEYEVEVLGQRSPVVVRAGEIVRF